MNSLIPQIPLDLFLKIGIPIIFNALGFGIKLTSKIPQYKKEIRSNSRVDPETGISYLEGKDVRKLLKFNDKKYLISLVRTSLSAGILGIIYILFSSIESLGSQEWYKVLVPICGWIALLLVLASIIISGILYIRMIQLWSKARR